MLEITRVRSTGGTPFVLEIDELLPLKFRAYEELFSAGYLRLGNFSTTLLELGIEAYSQVLFEVTVTSIDALSPWPPFSVEATSKGLPALATDFEGWKAVDLQQEFTTSVRDGEILVFWEELGQIEACEFEGKVRFLIGGGRLIGIWFVALSKEEVALYASHALQGM
jgi:hypothetical protein